MTVDDGDASDAGSDNKAKIGEKLSPVTMSVSKTIIVIMYYYSYFLRKKT